MRSIVIYRTSNFRGYNTVATISIRKKNVPLVSNFSHHGKETSGERASIFQHRPKYIDDITPGERAGITILHIPFHSVALSLPPCLADARARARTRMCPLCSHEHNFSCVYTWHETSRASIRAFALLRSKCNTVHSRLLCI